MNFFFMSLFTEHLFVVVYNPRKKVVVASLQISLYLHNFVKCHPLEVQIKQNGDISMEI